MEHVGLLPGTDSFGLVVSVVDSLRNEPAAGQWGLYQPRLRELEGERVVIRGGGRLHGNVCPTALRDAARLTRAEFFRSGVLSAPQVVDLQYDVVADAGGRGVVVAADHDSLAMLTSYVNLDRIMAFNHRELGDTSPASTTPATVAFYGEVGVGCEPLGAGLPAPSLPLQTADVAAYVPTADMFLLTRDAFTSYGVELINNPGVQAHELAHRVFTHNVLREEGAFRKHVLRRMGTPQQRESTCSNPTPDDDVNPCDATDLLLRGMDEGFSDILAYAFTGVTDFLLHHSFPAPPLGDSTEAAQRDLRGGRVSGDVQRYSSATVREAARGRLLPHRLGTLFSRAFYHGIHREDGTPPADDADRLRLARAHFAPALIRAVAALSTDLAVEYRFDARQLLRRYLEEVLRPHHDGSDAPLRDAACRALCERFGDLPFAHPVNQAAAQCNHVLVQGRACQL